jgi:dTDP-4-dehydrorhamnose reductase
MNILILGSSGLLGRELFEFLKSHKRINVIHNGLKSKKLNINNKFKLEKLILDSNPSLIINASGITNIDSCEKEKKHSYRINVSTVKNIFKIKKKFKLNFFFIQFSTDQLYDNRAKISNKENDKTYINNEYSKQKLAVEKVCLRENATIFRTNFFGRSRYKDSFDQWVYKSFVSKKNFFLFIDQFFSPLRIKTICKIIKHIIFKKKYIKGIFNLGSNNGLSKIEFSKIFAKKNLIYNNYFIPAEINTICKVKRSKNMLLNVKKFEKIFQIKLPKLLNEINSEIKNNY